MSIVMGVCLFISSAPTLTKAETIEGQTEKENVLFTVTVKDEKELKEFLNELDKNNKKAEKLWEQAQKEEKSQNENIDRKETEDLDEVHASVYTDQRDEHKTIMFNGARAYLGAYAYFTVIWSGANVIGSVQNYYFYGDDSDTTLSNVVQSYKILDRGRTLALSGNFLVGVASSTGSTRYYPLNTYVEMYVSGGYWWP
jgi:hypothetical protein